MINVCVRFAFRGARVICVKNLLALISSVLMIIFKKCFASISCGVDKNRAAVVLKTMKAPKVGDSGDGQKAGNTMLRPTGLMQRSKSFQVKL